jgi:hypothetical protein
MEMPFRSEDTGENRDYKTLCLVDSGFVAAARVLGGQQSATFKLRRKR